jgi:hypothetical protein
MMLILKLVMLKKNTKELKNEKWKVKMKNKKRKWK